LPWTGTTTGDATQAPFSDDDWALVWKLLFGGDGVVYNSQEELTASVVSERVRLGAGAALVGGRLYKSDAPLFFTPTAPAAATRVDRVVLRADWTARTVRAVLVENTETGTGAPPELVQEDGYQWEIAVCTVAVTTGGAVTVVDEREFVPRTERTLSMFIPCQGGRDSSTATTLYGTNVEGAILLGASVVTAGYGGFVLPAGYVGDGIVSAVVRNSSAGDIVCENDIYHGELDQDYNEYTETASGTIALGDDQIAVIAPVALGDEKRGDMVTMRFLRTGSDGADTAGDVHLWGWVLTYKAGN